MSTGHGDVHREDAFRVPRSIGDSMPISIEGDDAGIDQFYGAAEAVVLPI
ncbi:hypothetical protein [Brevibacterium sp. FME37]|nr:hypothetical protein [Brevibacterium sp. FME37]